MSINILPLRVPIGKTTVNGVTSDVFMTNEFSRSLTDLLMRVGGTDGPSTDDLNKLIAALKAQTDLLSSLVDAIQARTTEQEILQAMTLEDSTSAVLDEIGVESLAASVYSMVGRLDALALEFATAPERGGLAQQLADVAMQLALADSPPPRQKYTVTGAKAGNAALTSLLATLAKAGYITDSTT